MIEQLLHNAPLVSSLVALIIAQLTKPFIHLLGDRKFNWRLIFSTGNMPSSHSACVVALATSLFIVTGPSSISFAVAVVFTLIVTHDAMGIRRAAGKQAEVINEWSRVLASIHQDGLFSPQNLKTMLGHSFSQVFGGVLLGILVGWGTTAIIV